MFGGGPGPPADQNANIITPTMDESSGQCNNGWVCEHRWSEIRNMVRFRNVVGKAPRISWWDNNGNQIAFCRGIRGFVAFNNEQEDMDVTIFTCLPEGSYCDVITGQKKGNDCTGTKVVVDENGEGRIRITSKVGVLAIHIEVATKYLLYCFEAIAVAIISTLLLPGKATMKRGLRIFIEYLEISTMQKLLLAFDAPIILTLFVHQLIERPVKSSFSYVKIHSDEKKNNIHICTIFILNI